MRSNSALVLTELTLAGKLLAEVERLLVAASQDDSMNAVKIVNIERDGPDGILVTFSDGTIAGYVAEELIELRPVREKVALLKVAASEAEHLP
jgi:hypothetical protein